MSDDGPYAYLLIVRRECEEKLAFLQSAFAGRAGVCVMPDRRQGERRTRAERVEPERRRRDRRGDPPPSWDVADYVLVAQRHPQ